jgi:hypothetical protein
LTQNVDYTVKYSNNVNAGIACATLTFYGNFTGTKTLYFTILPKAAKLTSVKKISSGSFKATWSKQSGIAGYQICYSQKSDFSNCKYVTVTSKNTVSKTVSGLKKGKTYYVKVRAYAKLNSAIKCYGKYSSAVKVKV